MVKKQTVSKVSRKRRQAYYKPKVLHVFELEALAVACTDTNAKVEPALGCNPGALFS